MGLKRGIGVIGAVRSGWGRIIDMMMGGHQDVKEARDNWAGCASCSWARIGSFVPSVVYSIGSLFHRLFIA